VSRSNDVFRHLTEEETQALVGAMRDGMRPLYKELEKVAAATLKLRPVFLGKQPFPKRCEMIRKAMSLKVNAESAGDLLAAFFLEKHKADVVELLDSLGVEHEDGGLKETAPKQPSKKKLTAVVKEFPQGGNAVLRGVLLRAFAAQSAVDWPDLDAMLFPEPATTGAKR
jgi:hypothetical protein